MGRLSLELRTAIVEKKPIFAVAELDIGGTTYGYSGQWVASDTFGIYKAQVENNGFGSIAQKVSIENGALQSGATSVTIRDIDQTIHKLVEGEYGRFVKGSAARIKIVSPVIDADKYYTAFTGEIDSYNQIGPRVWKFNIKGNDKPLRSIIKTPILNTTDWPDIHGDVIGQRAPLVLGKHESTGTEATGMVPTFYVDTVGYRYLISVSKLKAVNDVFIDGIDSVTAGENWVFKNTPKVNGRTYSYIDFTDDQGDAVITVDVDGVRDIGEFTSDGIAETNPAIQLKIVLVNFIFGEYQTGTWLDYRVNSPYIDYPSFTRTAAFFDVHNITGSRVLQGEKGIQTINDWAKVFQCYVYWTNEGKIAVAPDKYIFETEELYFDWPWLTEEHCLDIPKYNYNTDQLLDEVQANFLYSATDGKSFDSVRVKDTLRGWDVTEELNLNWGLASLV